MEPGNVCIQWVKSKLNREFLCCIISYHQFPFSKHALPISLTPGSLKETRTKLQASLMVAIRAISHLCNAWVLPISTVETPRLTPGIGRFIRLLLQAFSYLPGRPPPGIVERLKEIKLGTAPSGPGTLLVLLSLTFSSLHKTILLQLPVSYSVFFSSPFLITRVPPEPPASLRSLLQATGHSVITGLRSLHPGCLSLIVGLLNVPHLLNLSLGGEIWRLSSSADRVLYSCAFHATIWSSWWPSSYWVTCMWMFIFLCDFHGLGCLFLCL